MSYGYPLLNVLSGSVLTPVVHSILNCQRTICCSIAQSYLDSLQPHGLQACQTSLSFSISQSFLKLMSIESMMPSHPLSLKPKCDKSLPCMKLWWLHITVGMKSKPFNIIYTVFYQLFPVYLSKFISEVFPYVLPRSSLCFSPEHHLYSFFTPGPSYSVLPLPRTCFFCTLLASWFFLILQIFVTFPKSFLIPISYHVFSYQFSHSVVSDSICDPMNHSTPGLPVHHQLPEVTQTHAHRVGDAIQPSHPLSSLLLLPPIPPSIRVFSNESTLHMRWPKYWRFSFSISPSSEHPGLISLGWTTGWILKVFSNTTVQKHQFFSAQPSSQSNSHIHTRPLEKVQLSDCLKLLSPPLGRTGTLSLLLSRHLLATPPPRMFHKYLWIDESLN